VKFAALVKDVNGLKSHFDYIIKTCHEWPLLVHSKISPIDPAKAAVVPSTQQVWVAR